MKGYIGYERIRKHRIGYARTGWIVLLNLEEDKII